MCKYCEKEKHIKEHEDDKIFLSIYGSILRLQGKIFSYYFGRNMKINYCPMCGRKLS